MALREQEAREADSWYPPKAQSVGSARRMVMAVLREQGLEGDDAGLLVSELAANVIEHARTPFAVAVQVGSVIRIEVADESKVLPTITNPTPHSERGRGLAIVRALSSRWGVELRPAGKVVWFELPLTPAG